MAGISRVCTGSSNNPDTFVWYTHFLPLMRRTSSLRIPWADEEQNESTEVDPGVTQDILRRCAHLAPEFAAVSRNDIVNEVCGLRPVRSTVRVEAERITPDYLLVHNYGHGGAGITLSWGCAAEVVEIVAEASRA